MTRPTVECAYCRHSNPFDYAECEECGRTFEEARSHAAAARVERKRAARHGAAAILAAANLPANYGTDRGPTLADGWPSVAESGAASGVCLDDANGAWVRVWIYVPTD